MVQLSIPVANAAALVTAGYTTIEVWVSTDQGNSFQEVTAATAMPAQLYAMPASTTYQMGGHELRFEINGGSEQTADFNTIVPNWTPTQVADAINVVDPSIASVSLDETTLILTSPTTGRASEVNITYNDAPSLGWTSGTITYGRDARIPLVGTTYLYLYTDVSGLNAFQYKWRFSANGANPISDFSAVVHGTVPPATPIAIATGTFVGLNGQPAQVTLIVVPDGDPQRVGGVTFTQPQPVTYQTDVNGFLQAPLAQGAVIRVGIEGTSFVRQITVPTGVGTPTFDIFAAMAAAPDPWAIQTPLPFLVRRSM